MGKGEIEAYGWGESKWQKTNIIMILQMNYLLMKFMRGYSLTAFLLKSFLRCSQQKAFSTIANLSHLLSLKNRQNTFITRAWEISTRPVLWVSRILWHISACANTYQRYGHSFSNILKKKPKRRNILSAEPTSARWRDLIRCFLWTIRTGKTMAHQSRICCLGQNIWFMLMFQTVFRVYILMLFHGYWSVKM